MRNAAQKLGRFSLGQMLDALELPLRDADSEGKVINRLTELAMAGSVKILRPGSYEYQRPTGTSPARPRQTTPEQHAVATTPRATAAGTSARKKGGANSGNKEVQALLDAVTAQWGADKISKAGKSHWQIAHKDAPAGRVLLASTPNAAGLVKDKAKLRKLGLKGI